MEGLARSTCQVHKDHAPRIDRAAGWFTVVDHHIHPTSEGGPDTAANKVRVCPTGHSAIHEVIAHHLRTKGNPSWTTLQRYHPEERRYALKGFEAILKARRARGVPESRLYAPLGYAESAPPAEPAPVLSMGAGATSASSLPPDAVVTNFTSDILPDPEKETLLPTKRERFIRYMTDLGERVLKTFLQAFIAQVVASGLGIFGAVTDLAVVQKAGLAGLAAVAALIFGLVARWVGAPDSASFLPADQDPPQGDG